MKKFRIGKAIMIITIIIAATLLFTFFVMQLWNAILPAVIGVKAITFVQALGILILSKILFGGFRGGWGGGNRWKHSMKEKWDTMTPDQRNQFKAEWRNRCGGRWGMRTQSEPVEKNTGHQE